MGPGRRRRGWRFTAHAAAVALLLTACTGDPESSPAPGASSSGSSGATTGASTGARLAPDCPLVEQRVAPSADRLNDLVASLDLPAWQAADIGASGRLRDGRLVWLFGDTVREDRFSPRIVANSMLISSGQCVGQVREPDDGPVIPDVDENTVHWPMSVAVAHTGAADTIVVICSRIRRGDKGSFDFTYLGSTAAVFSVERGGVPELVKTVELTEDSRDPEQVNWGAAATVHEGWYYVYGTRLTGTAGEFGRELHVVRSPVDDPGDRSRWEFWDGSRWQSKRGTSAVILPATLGVSQTLSVDRVGREYVAISKRDGDVGDFVYKWTSPTPHGPWTPSQEVRAPAGFDTGKLEYAPLGHPEITLASGNLLVSVSRNTTDLQRLLKDPEIGRPLFVEVPLD